MAVVRGSRVLAAYAALILFTACGEDAEGPEELLDGGAIVTPGAYDAGADASTPVIDAGVANDGSQLTPSGDGGAPPVNAGSGFIRGPEPTSASASKLGPYKVESATEGFRAAMAYGAATLWWPSDAEAPFGFVSVVPGFVSVQGQIINWGSFLASHGIVAITIDTVTPVDQPPARADALLDALKTVAAENERMASPLFGKLDLTRQGVIGWSMGGGGALLAAERTPSLKAAISLAGWNPQYNYMAVKVPALLFATQTDSLAGGQSVGFYDTIPSSTPKLYWEADNTSAFFGGHDTFNDPANLDGAVGRYGLSWLKVFLEGDERYEQFLKQEPPKKVTYQTNL